MDLVVFLFAGTSVGFNMKAITVFMINYYKNINYSLNELMVLKLLYEMCEEIRIYA